MSAHGHRQRKPGSVYTSGPQPSIYLHITDLPSASFFLPFSKEIVKILVEHFASRPKEEKQAYLDAPNEFGNTGLHWAAMGGHLDVVKYLVAEGASPALANDKNYIPLDLASFGEKMNVVDYFLSQMDKLESTNEGEGGLEGAAASMEITDEGDKEDKEEEGEKGEAGEASK